MVYEVYFPHMAAPADAAAASGLAVYHIRRLVKEGQVKSIRCGRKILVNLDSLAAYMNEGTQPQSVTAGGVRRIEV